MSKDVQQSIQSATRLTFLYCLPAILAIVVIAGSYFQRAGKVGDYLATERDRVEKALKEVKNQAAAQGNNGERIAEALLQHKLISEILDDPDSSAQLKQLIHYFVQHRLEHVAVSPAAYVEKSNQRIRDEINRIWERNSSIIAVMALLPFLLLGSHLGFSEKLPAPLSARMAVVNQSWWMKFLIAFVLAYGWVYIINPTGRGAGTIEQFLIAVDLSQDETLPIFIKDMKLTPIIAGFLGWYLYLLTYFFTKLTTHDVMSTKAYGLMFQKFLFTYGIAIIMPAVQSGGVAELPSDSGYDATNLLAFFTGYFPMSAFSLLKDTGLKMLHRTDSEKGQLQELPGISRWQILRLEEEGINSMGTLAYCCREELHQDIPAMYNLVGYWIDIAQLYTVLGQEKYLLVKKYCRTASEFILRSGERDFVDTLASENIVNIPEIARLLKRTFPSVLSDSQE